MPLADFGLTAYDDPNFYCDNVQVRILIRNGKTLVGIAGSNGWCRDWIQDARGFLVSRGGGKYKLFDGFADMSDKAVPRLLDYLKTFPDPIHIATHSAGGPIGGRLAVKLTEAGRKPAMLQRLACPCTGNGEWSEYFRSLKIPTVDVGLWKDPVVEAYKSRGGVPESETLWLDENGFEREPDQCLTGALTEHPGKNYIRALRMYLKAG